MRYAVALVVMAAPLFAAAAKIGSVADAVVDLATPDAVRVVKGEWRFSNIKVVLTEFRSPGQDGQPTGGPVKTYDIEPHAGGVEFNDAQWEVIAPESLAQRRSTGRFCFA